MKSISSNPKCSECLLSKVCRFRNNWIVGMEGIIETSFGGVSAAWVAMDELVYAVCQFKPPVPFDSPITPPVTDPRDTSIFNLPDQNELAFESIRVKDPTEDTLKPATNSDANEKEALKIIDGMISAFLRLHSTSAPIDCREYPEYLDALKFWSKSETKKKLIKE